jgi:hypothetical protein
MSAEDDELSAAERRLVALLAVLSSDELRLSPTLGRSVLARARWELRVRRAVHTLDAFSRTLGAGLALALGGRAGARR